MKLSRDENLEVPLSSLIDIVFLLIIFFVVTSNMDREKIDRDIVLAESNYIPRTKAEGTEQKVTVNIRYDKTLDRSYYSINGVSMDILEVESTLRRTKAEFGNTIPVIFRADGETPYREIHKINQVIGRIGLYRVTHTSEDKPATE